MSKLDDLKETWEALDWFDKLVLAFVVVILIGEWQGWWNDTGVIALNAIIVGELFSVKGLMKDIERNTRD